MMSPGSVAGLRYSDTANSAPSKSPWSAIIRKFYTRASVRDLRRRAIQQLGFGLLINTKQTAELLSRFDPRLNNELIKHDASNKYGI